jgi:hypothetical protein
MMRHVGGRWARVLGFAGAGVAALGVSIWMLRRLKFGDVDPLSAGIGFVSLLVGVAALVVSVRAWRMQQVDVASLAGRLAAAVLSREQRARRQLLGDPGRTIDVRFDLRPAPAHNAEQAARQGSLSEVADYYRKLRPARMVITGAPGAGKTVLAVELMMMLLQSLRPADPVPVRLSATSWKLSDDDLAPSPGIDAQAMQRWLVTHLMDVYQLSPKSAQSLVDANRILPVIDGLDELDATDKPGYASRAGQALQVLNAFQRYRDRAALIVTCRSGQYEALTDDRAWVQDAARVEIRPVSVAQARTFITARAVDVGRWQTVLDRIDGDRRGPLAAGLATPWRLTLAATVYEQRDRAGGFPRDPHELTSPDMDGAEKVRDHLLELFIPAALHGITGWRPNPARTHSWLAVLAAYLYHNARTGRSLGGRPLSATDIVLHELWPLAGDRRPRIVGVAMLAVIWAGAFPIMLAYVPVSLSTRQLLFGVGVPALSSAWVANRSWSTLWPPPKRLNLARLLTSLGGREAAVKVEVTTVATAGLAFGLVSGLVFGPVVGLVFGLAFGLVTGLVTGLLTGLAEDAEIGVKDPQLIVRDDLTAGLVSGLVAGLASGLVLGLVFGPITGLAFGLVVMLTLGLALAQGGGPAGWRYIAFLLCTRRRSGRWLPWRLGRFLDACYRAGLLRIAGNGYQFRHRELQDYLARHPLP